MLGPPFNPNGRKGNRWIALSSHEQRMERLGVAVVAPDRSLRVRLSRIGFEIEIVPTAFERHTEESLAVLLSEAVRDALRGRDTAIRRLAAEPGTASRHRSAAVQARLDRFEAAVEMIEAVADSPRGYVRVTWRGTADVAFRLRRRTLRLVDVELLAAEAVAALTAAQLSRRAQQTEAHQRSFRSPGAER